MLLRGNNHFPLPVHKSRYCVQLLPVAKGAGKSADVSLEMERNDFQAMMMNRLDLERAVREGRVRIDGQLPVLVSFAQVLEPRSMEY